MAWTSARGCRAMQGRKRGQSQRAYRVSASMDVLKQRLRCKRCSDFCSNFCLRVRQTASSADKPAVMHRFRPRSLREKIQTL